MKLLSAPEPRLPDPITVTETWLRYKGNVWKLWNGVVVDYWPEDEAPVSHPNLAIHPDSPTSTPESCGWPADPEASGDPLPR